MFVVKQRMGKGCVPLSWSGCTAASIHKCDPTSDQHGGFDLLRYRPGPVHPSLSDLVTPDSPRSTMEMLILVRTPDRHRQPQPRTPDLKQSCSLSLPAAWITSARHCTRQIQLLFQLPSVENSSSCSTAVNTTNTMPCFICSPGDNYCASSYSLVAISESISTTRVNAIFWLAIKFLIYPEIQRASPAPCQLSWPPV